MSLARLLPPPPALDGLNEDDALKVLNAFLEPRGEEAQRDQTSCKCLDDIRREARKRAGVQPNRDPSMNLRLRRTDSCVDPGATRLKRGGPELTDRNLSEIEC